MASEIQVTQKMTMAQGEFAYSWNPAPYVGGNWLAFDLVGAPYCDTGLLTVATGGTDFTLTNVTTAGFVALRNTDATNYCDIGYNDSGTFRPLMRLLPNEIAMFRLIPGTTLRGQAHTASTMIQYMIFQA